MYVFTCSYLVLANTDDISLHGSTESGLHIPHLLHVYPLASGDNGQGALLQNVRRNPFPQSNKSLCWVTNLCNDNPPPPFSPDIPALPGIAIIFLTRLHLLTPESRRPNVVSWIVYFSRTVFTMGAPWILVALE